MEYELTEAMRESIARLVALYGEKRVRHEAFDVNTQYAVSVYFPEINKHHAVRINRDGMVELWSKNIPAEEYFPWWIKNRMEEQNATQKG